MGEGQTPGSRECTHGVSDAIYVFRLEGELNYGSNVQCDVHSKDGPNQMKAGVTM